MKIINVKPPEEHEMVCDFCNSPVVVWSYPARDSNMILLETMESNTFLGNRGGWAACEKCSELIEAGDEKGLLEWSLKTMREKNKKNMPDEIIRKVMRQVHRAFWENRLGERVRVGGTT
jgi:hypothetical protein